MDPVWSWTPAPPDGLCFAFQGWPPEVAMLVRELLGASGGWVGTDAGGPSIVWHGSMSVLTAGASSDGWVWQPRGAVAALGEKVRVEVEHRAGHAVIGVMGEATDVLRQLVWRVLPAVLGELALSRGWLLLHAAAVLWKDGALVFPGPSGAGKSTIAAAAAAAGWPVLADDLVWVRVAEGSGPRVVGFPRGGWEEVVSSSSWKGRFAPVTAWVFPKLGEPGQRQVQRLLPRFALQSLWDAWVGLGAPSTAATRFAGCIQLAQLPSFSWVRPRYFPEMCRGAWPAPRKGAGK